MGGLFPKAKLGLVALALAVALSELEVGQM